MQLAKPEQQSLNYIFRNSGYRELTKEEDAKAREEFVMPPVSVNMRIPTINFPTFQQTFVVVQENMGVLRNSNQGDLKNFIFNQIEKASNKAIQILSASLSPLKDHLEDFARLVKNALKRKCKIEIAIADPDHQLFDLLSPNPAEARARITNICSLFKESLNHGLKIYLVGDAFFNSSYHFGDKLLVISYIMKEFSATSTSALIMGNQNSLFEVYETQFAKVITNKTISRPLHKEE